MYGIAMSLTVSEAVAYATTKVLSLYYGSFPRACLITVVTDSLSWFIDSHVNSLWVSIEYWSEQVLLELKVSIHH